MQSLHAHRRKLPLTLHMTGTISWCAIGILLLCSSGVDTEFWWLSLCGALFITAGILSCRSYFTHVPSISINAATIAIGNDLHTAGSIIKVRRIAENNRTWFRALGILMLVLAIVLLVAAVASIASGEGGLLDCFGDIGFLDFNNRKRDALLIHFEGGTTKTILLTMYANCNDIETRLRALASRPHSGIDDLPKRYPS